MELVTIAFVLSQTLSLSSILTLIISLVSGMRFALRQCYVVRVFVRWISSEACNLPPYMMHVRNLHFSGLSDCVGTVILICDPIVCTLFHKLQMLRLNQVPLTTNGEKA